MHLTKLTSHVVGSARIVASTRWGVASSRLARTTRHHNYPHTNTNQQRRHDIDPAPDQVPTWRPDRARNRPYYRGIISIHPVGVEENDWSLVHGFGNLTADISRIAERRRELYNRASVLPLLCLLLAISWPAHRTELRLTHPPGR